MKPNKRFESDSRKPRAPQADRSAGHMKYVAVLVLMLTSTAACEARGATIALSAKAFAAHKSDRGVVLLHVNWGRRWNCHGYDNAQLQKLVFHSLPIDAKGSESLELNIPSRLFANDGFQRYALLVAPGEYALSGFRFKVAASVSDLRIYEPDAATLVADGKAKAGSFRVAAGEIVYIGHFGVDCNGEPTPWRFYIEQAQDFEKYSSELHREFPSTLPVAVTYRLFATETIGTPYSLPTAQTKDSQPNNTLEPTQ
jgi:hypothetical protein